MTESSLALSTLPRLLADQGGEQVAAVADLFTSFRVFDVNVERARRPAGGGGGGEEERLQQDASNLAPFLRYLHDVHAASFAQLCEYAHHFVPGLRDVVVAPASGAERGWQIELVEGGIEHPHPVTPAWELEAWWILFPEAVKEAFPSWRKPADFVGKSVGSIKDAKERLGRAIRPPNAKAGFRGYAESDSRRIAEHVRDRGEADAPQGRSGSYDAFRGHVAACAERLSSG